MDIVNDADVASVVDEPGTRLSPGGPERATSGTPAGIKSSPPALSTRVVASPEVEDASPVGPKSDSDAETILLPGVNSHSPSKVRKAIKLEDKSNESGVLDGIVDMNDDMVNAEVPSEGATSNLGKRKRSKHGNPRHDRHEPPRNGNSSGLSSVPSSPVATIRSSMSKQAESESEPSKSPSPRTARSVKAKSVDSDTPQDASREAVSADDKEQRKTRRRRSSGHEVTGRQNQQSTDLPLKLHAESNSRNPTRSTSPPLQAHRRSASTNSAANGLNHKKRKLPAPLRATRDRRSTDDHSDDDSSVGESPHPRRSRTRNLASPPTGDSSVSLAKMPPHKKRNPFGRTALADACEDGDINKARKLLHEKPEDLDVADAAGNTPLQCASLNGHEDVVKLLLDAGCNIHCVNYTKDSPLLDAVENGHLEVVKLLLAAGVNPKIRNEEGEEPINKIDESGENADAIRQALLRARAIVGPTQPSAPVQSPQMESYSSRSRRTQSHGRSTKTGEHQLYTSYNVNSLRSAAARGDLQTVGNILQVIVTPGFDDPESLVAAARGGHDEVLQILLGFGNADPDPPPLEHKDWEHATPMLAAIGSDNIKVIELLLAKVEDNRFDPTKRFNGNTYYEIARQRMGPLWEEEERILKAAFDNYSSRTNARPSAASQQATARGHQKKLSDSDGRSNGPKSRPQVTGGTAHGVKRDQKGSPTTGSTPVKRGPGRPRKEGNEPSSTTNREPSSSTSHKEKVQSRKQDSDNAPPPSDTEPTKPRRKLISGKDLKGEREKQRRASAASLPSSSTLLAESSSGENAQANAMTGKATPRLVSSATEPDITSEKSLDRAQSIKRDDSKDRLSAIRGESPTKRPRKSQTPPSESHESSSLKAPDHGMPNKRRRLETEAKAANRADARWSSSPDHRTTSCPSGLSSERVSVEDDHMPQSKTLSGKGTARNPDSRENRASAGNPKKSCSDDAATSQLMRTDLEDQSKQESDNDVTLTEEKVAVEQRRRRASWNQSHAKDEGPQVKRELEEKEERERVENARLAQQLIQQRAKEEAAKRQEEETKRQQEEVRYQQEEARRQQEEARRQQEEARRFYDEQVRIKREEQERRKAAQKAEEQAERRRLQQEKEAARLAKLPPLLRWFDGYPQPATREIASEFRVMQGVRYDTIKPEASDASDAREQWLLNTQVALLLGEKDLQLSRYTAWEHIPVSELAKKALWKVESERYAMINAGLRSYNPALLVDGTGSSRQVSYSKMSEMRAEAWPLFLSLDMFFVKVSDFMFIVPKFPHLKGLQLQVQYRELPPDSSWLDKLTFPGKWKQDPDADANYGFAPGAKIYVNGELIHEDKPKLAQTSNMPFPEHRVPRIGLRQVFPNDPDYERLCIEQGLEHLLQGRDHAVNGHMISPNGAMGITPPESTNGEARRASDASQLTFSVASHDVPNEINSVL